MSTATAPEASKSARASQLRAEIQKLEQEVSALKVKVNGSTGRLGALEETRRRYSQAAAEGHPPKPGALTMLDREIADVKLPLETLTERLSEKQSALESARASLEALTREIAIEQEKAARQVRYDSLKKEGDEVAARISEKLRSLIQDDLPAFDAVRDSLLREFVGGACSVEAGPEINAARAFIHELEGGLRDGPFLRIERKLLRQGWEVRGDLIFEVKNLRPPK